MDFMTSSTHQSLADKMRTNVANIIGILMDFRGRAWHNLYDRIWFEHRS